MENLSKDLGAELTEADDKLELVESLAIESEDFKKSVVIPYFKDIYKVSIEITKKGSCGEIRRQAQGYSQDSVDGIRQPPRNPL